MVAACFKTNPEIFTPLPLLPARADTTSFGMLFQGDIIPFASQFTNTVISSTLQTLLAVGICAGTGFVLGCFTFSYKRLALALVMMTVLIPRQVLAIPMMAWFHQLHLLDKWWTIVIPGSLSGMGALYLTFIYQRLPKDLLDAARLEGASEWRVFLMSLPLIAPALVTYGLVHFIFGWQEHVIPLALLHSESQMTVSLGLGTLYGSDSRFPYSVLMAGSTLIVLPVVILFLVTFKWTRSALAELTSAGMDT
jgi:multiple sugar transport system permease protein